MDNKTYADLAMRTEPLDLPPITKEQEHLIIMALGLAGEAGEVAEMVKKHVFHGHPMSAEKVRHLLRELGDVLWYANYGALKCIKVSDLGVVMDANIQKLTARYPEGTFTTERSMHRAEGDN